MNSRIAEIVAQIAKQEAFPPNLEPPELNTTEKKLAYIKESDNAIIKNACKYGYLPIVKKMYSPGNSELVHIAASHGKVHILEFLIRKGEDPNQIEERYQETPLHKACEFGHLFVVDYLLSVGADPNQTNKFGTTPITYACQNGNVPIIKSLIVKGAYYTHIQNNGDTLLHDAAYGGHCDAVKLLMELGLSPFVKNNDKETPIDQAIKKGHGDVSRLMRGIQEEDENSDDDLFGPETDDEGQLEWAEDARSVCAMSVDNHSCCSGGGDD